MLRGQELLDLITNLDPAYIEAAAEPPKAKRSVRLKWGAAAACACLMIAVFAVGTLRESGGDRGGFFSGSDGIWQAGIDPVVASVAVIPAGSDLRDVAEASCVSIREEDARNVDILGNYIPAALPYGCRYDRAYYYETIMKDGTRYHMIRMEGSIPPDGEGAGEVTGDGAFLWMVWGHRPDTDLPVYQPEEVSVSLVEQQEGRVFYIDYGEVYVGVEQWEIRTEDLLAVIRSVG